MTPELVQYFKAALDDLGLGGGPCRPPRLPLTEAELATARRAVEHCARARPSSRSSGAAIGSGAEVEGHV